MMENFEKDKIDVIDLAYETNLSKYGNENARIAITNLLMNYEQDLISRDNGAREKVSQLLYADYSHILVNHTVSCFCIRHRDDRSVYFDGNDITEFINSSDKSKYHPDEINDMVAVLSCIFPEQVYVMLSINPDIKQTLVNSFVSERYCCGNKELLDNSQPLWIPFKHDNVDILYVGKEAVSRSFANMKREEISERKSYNV